MMAVTFQDIVLDTGGTDDRAILVLRDGRLTAILSHLDDMHEELAGHWFVEAIFGVSPGVQQYVFTDPHAFADWLADQPV